MSGDSQLWCGGGLGTRRALACRWVLGACSCQDPGGLLAHTAPWLLAHSTPCAPPCNPVLAGVEHESQVDRTLSPHIKANLLSVRDWRGYRNPWMPEGGAHAGMGVM